MLLSEFKEKLKSVSEVTFLNTNGKIIPNHFHITELGQINKRFIDCGGTIRTESVISMQLWEGVDLWHRIEPSKLIDITTEKLNLENSEIEIEYQDESIGKYGVAFENGKFKLTTKNTTCLASNSCGLPSFAKVQETIKACCSTNNTCC
jgi:hypothetical protein